MDDRQSVLIVEPSEDSREVLQTALERRGMRVFWASLSTPPREMVPPDRPDLIVLDLELADSTLEDVSARFAQQARTEQTPLVILGSVRRDHAGFADGEFVAKPYHYGPLIRRIEEML